ncbi:MAG: hypothetical protein JWP63_5650 [Candidatus Solibacter sp.]|nr:hypothetical protein [Candidatus Solibacter sp.]
MTSVANSNETSAKKPRKFSAVARRRMAEGPRSSRQDQKGPARLSNVGWAILPAAAFPGSPSRWLIAS